MWETQRVGLAITAIRTGTYSKPKIRMGHGREEEEETKRMKKRMQRFGDEEEKK